MAWEQLPEDYTDAVWSGLRRYNEIKNEDGTVSFQDVTAYSNKEKSFFGAKDANRMNQALNIIMGMVESGTDLYTAFLEYFSVQKELFESNVNLNMSDFEDYIAAKKAEGDAIVDDLKTDYRKEITEFETTQEQVFNTWFGFIKDQLGEDAAGNLQNQIIEIQESLDEIKITTEQKKLSFYNQVVSVSSFSANTTYEDYPFRASVPLEGVLDSMIPEVIFSIVDAISGNFAPVAESYNGGVYLYASDMPEADIVIPTILLWRGSV